MSQLISQSFKGIIPPILFDQSNGDGRIVPIIDWEMIAQKNLPVGAKNPVFEFSLEYLTATYWLPSLLKIPAQGYEMLKFGASEKQAERSAKIVKFKQQYGADSNYAIQFLLWNWYNGNWDQVNFDRDILQSTGMEGRYGLIVPYLVTAGDTVFGDRLYKLGMSIAPRWLTEFDKIYIHGGYSGSISYLWNEPEILLSEGMSGKISVGTVGREILYQEPRRAVLYVANAGNKRVYWIFGGNPGSILPKTSPFLEPGESLTFEHGQLVYPGGNQHHLLKGNSNSICKLSLNAISEDGVNDLVFQELLY